MNQARARQCELHMQEVWESWDWHFNDKLRQLDYLVRHIKKEMGMGGVPPDMWQPFLQAKLIDGIANCNKQAAAEEKPKGREVSSLVAIRQRRRMTQ